MWDEKLQDILGTKKVQADVIDVGKKTDLPPAVIDDEVKKAGLPPTQDLLWRNFDAALACHQEEDATTTMTI